MIWLAAGLLTLSAAKSAEGALSPYCGIYSVFAAANHFGRAVEFPQLISPRYVSTMDGSTVEDLVRALEDLGMTAIPVKDLHLSQLKSARNPVILHARSPNLRAVYRHWVLYLGIDGEGRIVLYDPPRGKLIVSEAELLAIWDGRSIVLHEADAGRSLVQVALPWLGTCVLALLLIWILSSMKRLAWIAVPLTAGVMSAASMILSPNSFSRNPEAVAIVNAAHFLESAEEIDASAMRSLEGAILIDARTPEAYRRGHIPGAINISVFSGYGQLKEAFRRIPRDAPVVCYCQHADCGWSDVVANQLLQRGCSRVFIYRKGYEDWLEKPGEGQ
jgi:rhodanese-related sulfurtransferase